MKIELKCPTCESVLRVDAQHAGKQLRCPNCQNVTAIPLDVTNPTSFPTEPSVFDQPMDDVNETHPHYIASNATTTNEDSSQQTTSLIFGLLGIVLTFGCSGCLSPVLFFLNLYGFYIALNSNGPLKLACLITNGIALLLAFCIGGFWLATVLA